MIRIEERGFDVVVVGVRNDMIRYEDFAIDLNTCSATVRGDDALYRCVRTDRHTSALRDALESTDNGCDSAMRIPHAQSEVHVRHQAVDARRRLRRATEEDDRVHEDLARFVGCESLVDEAFETAEHFDRDADLGESRVEHVERRAVFLLEEKTRVLVLALGFFEERTQFSVTIRFERCEELLVSLRIRTDVDRAIGEDESIRRVETFETVVIRRLLIEEREEALEDIGS